MIFAWLHFAFKMEMFGLGTDVETCIAAFCWCSLRFYVLHHTSSRFAMSKLIIVVCHEHSIIHFVIILSHEKSNKNSDHVHSSSSIAMTRLCNVFHHTIEISLILMLLKIMKVIPLPVQICTSQLWLISVMTMPMLVMMIVILNLNCTF